MPVRRKHPVLLNIAFIIIILALLFAIIYFGLRIVTRHNQEFTVPDFTGMSLPQAEAATGKAELRLEISDSVYIRGMERGTISRQNPAPGSKVKKNRRILLVINSVLPRQVEMPSLIGYSLRQARTELASQGLSIGRLVYVEDMATNNVLAQQFRGEDIAPGTKVDSDTRIDLVLGMNPDNQHTFGPSVLGYKFQMAKDILYDNSLNVYHTGFDSSVSTYSDSLEAIVYRQFPEPSDSIAVLMGTPVSIYLSRDENTLSVLYDTTATAEPIDTVL